MSPEAPLVPYSVSETTALAVWQKQYIHLVVQLWWLCDGIKWGRV